MSHGTLSFVPAVLPHRLTVEDFAESRSLTDWMETWLSGFGDQAIDELYVEAQRLASVHVEVGDGQALCDVEPSLSAIQRFRIWRKLIGF